MVTYRLKYVDGSEVGREVVKEEITIKPVEKIIRVGVLETRTETETKPLPFEIVRVEDPETERGEEIIKQEGVDGEVKITYEVAYVRDEEVSRLAKSIDITIRPVNKIIAYGTFDKGAALVLDINGDGAINVADVQALYLHIMGIESLTLEKAALDYNEDGSVNVSDVQALYLHVMGIQKIAN